MKYLYIQNPSIARLCNAVYIFHFLWFGFNIGRTLLSNSFNAASKFISFSWCCKLKVCSANICLSYDSYEELAIFQRIVFIRARSVLTQLNILISIFLAIEMREGLKYKYAFTILVGNLMICSFHPDVFNTLHWRADVTISTQNVLSDEGPGFPIERT